MTKYENNFVSVVYSSLKRPHGPLFVMNERERDYISSTRYVGRVAVDAQIRLLPPVTFQYTGFVCPDRRSVLVSPRRFLVLGSVGLGDPVFGAPM